VIFKDAYLLIWTNDAVGTLPSNQAVAVNPDVTYVLVQGPDDRRYGAGRRRGCRPTPASLGDET